MLVYNSAASIIRIWSACGRACWLVLRHPAEPSIVLGCRVVVSLGQLNLSTSCLASTPRCCSSMMSSDCKVVFDDTCFSPLKAVWTEMLESQLITLPTRQFCLTSRHGIARYQALFDYSCFPTCSYKQDEQLCCSRVLQ